DQRTLELTNIALHAAGYEHRHVIRDSHADQITFSLQDRNLRLQIRWLDVCNQAPFETRVKTFLKRGYFTRRTIRTDHNLFLLIVESVEGMEEFFLRTLLAGHELNVVDQQHVD